MASLDPETPLDALEISYITENLGPYDWRKLGLYLGISENRLANWERQYMMNVEQAASQMLFTWHNNQRPASERGLLIAALEKCRMRSLGEKVRTGECRRTVPPGMRPIPPENYNHLPQQPQQNQPAPHAYHNPAPTYAPRPNPPPQPEYVRHQSNYEITEMKLRDLSNKLGSEWRMVGTYLGFDNAGIEVLKEQHTQLRECIFQMLLQWRNMNSDEATKEKLKKVLKRSQREDLVDFVDEPDD